MQRFVIVCKRYVIALSQVLVGDIVPSGEEESDNDAMGNIHTLAGRLSFETMI